MTGDKKSSDVHSHQNLLRLMKPHIDTLNVDKSKRIRVVLMCFNEDLNKN